MRRRQMCRGENAFAALSAEARKALRDRRPKLPGVRGKVTLPHARRSETGALVKRSYSGSLLLRVVLVAQSLHMSAPARASESTIALLPQAGVLADLQHGGGLLVGLAAAYAAPASPWAFGLRLSGEVGLRAGSLGVGPTIMRGATPGGPPLYRFDLSGRLTRAWLLDTSKPDILLGVDLGMDMFLFRWAYLRVLIGASHDRSTKADALAPNIGVGLSFL
jgi:hypothetical protein